MAVTGTITDSQGTQTLSSSAYDQLTITVVSGTYSVEYPVGTAIATDATTTASYQLGGGQCRITVNAGSVAYSLDQVADNYDLQKVKVLTSSEASILAAAGGLTPYATYIASDDPERTPQTAKDAYTLVAAAFNSAGAPWSVQAYSNLYGTQVASLESREPLLLPASGNKAAVSSVFANGELWNNVPLAASVAITASIAGTKMTVSAVGIATNPNGSTLSGAVNRGHFITATGVPSTAYIIFDPTDTGVHGTGIYTLSEDCGTVSSRAMTLSCANGIGGVLERVTDTFVGSSASVDTDAKKAWRLSIKTTHRVTGGHGRAQMLGNELAARKAYRVEHLFRFQESSNGSWQQTSSGVAMPENMLIASLSASNTSGYGGSQYVTNGMFAVNLTRGFLRPVMRAVDENYALKVGDYWTWDDADRTNQFDQASLGYFVKGYEPIRLVYETFLDERMKSEGGRGWLKCWINEMLVMDYVGPTLYPAGSGDGVVSPAQARFGMYDTNYSVVADNTLCSAVRSTAVERNLDFKYWRVKEIA